MTWSYALYAARLEHADYLVLRARPAPAWPPRDRGPVGMVSARAVTGSPRSCDGALARGLGHAGEGSEVTWLLAAQLGVYVMGYVFSDWASYTWHIHTSLDRLMAQAVPLAVLVVVETAAEVSNQVRRLW